MTQKIAIVFGGSRGIGAACVQALVAEGYEVAYTCTSGAPAPGDHTRAYQVDIRDAAQVAKVFADVQKDFGGKPHCVVANAPPGPAPAAPWGSLRHPSLRMQRVDRRLAVSAKPNPSNRVRVALHSTSP